MNLEKLWKLAVGCFVLVVLYSVAHTLLREAAFHPMSALAFFIVVALIIALARSGNKS